MMFLVGPKATVACLAFSPDGEQMAVGARDGSLAVANVLEGEFRVLVTDPPGIHAVAFDGSGANLLAGGNSGWSRFQRTEAGEWDVFVAPRPQATTALAFLGDKTLVVGSGSPAKTEPGQVELWNLATGKRREPYFREPSGIRAAAAHPATHHVAWANAGNRLAVWNTLTTEPRHVGLPHAAPSLAFHPDGATLAIAQEWGVKLYDVADRRERLTLKGHTGRVTAVAYSPDGRTLATASWDKTVRFWDVGGRELGTFDWEIGKVSALAFAPDGLRLAAGGENGLIALWDVE